jgi:hypothetical protein
VKHWITIAAFAAVVASAVGVARAEGEGDSGPGWAARFNEALGLSGSLRASYWSAARDLLGGRNLAVGSVWMAVQPKLVDTVYARAEGWVGDEDFVHLGQPIGDLREGYVDGTFGPLRLRVGRQLAVWGRADTLNPTDNLSPRDYTLLVVNDGDQRLGELVAKSSVTVGSFTLTEIWLPEFRPNTLPLGYPPAGVTMQEVYPGVVPAFAQGAFKIEQSGTALDWSISYFNGFDRNPDFGILSVSPTRLALGLVHKRIRVVGADADTTIGRFGLRAEAAYTFTDDSSGNDPLTKNPFLYGVVGGDRTFGEELNVNVQYAVRVITRWHDPTWAPAPLTEVAEQEALLTQQQDRVQNGMSLRVADKWINETLTAEVSGLYWFTRNNFVIRPRLGYEFTDHWTAVAGADVYGGPSDSFLGRLQSSSGAFVEVRYGL